MSRISSPYSLSSSSRPQSTTTINNNLNGQNIVMEEDLLQDETLYFERNRIKQLKDERRDIQKKTFTKWCNTYLSRARMEVQDLFADLGDGIMLLKFLEIISGESLGKPNRGRMRVQKIENINKSLEFLKQKKIQLENIGAEDIADGNEHLILGLIWTIILRFTIENIEIEAKESGERKHAKEALLLWCQRKTAGYPNVRIDNFSSSWRSGLAFCALIHAHHPELINFDGLNTQDPLSNLNMAFDVAERKLDIARLLDAEDVNVSCPDEKSIITYVSLFYHCFAKEKSELTGARRVAKVVGELVQLDSLQEDYEQLSADLLCWIHQKIKELADRHFPNLLIALRELLVTFSRFRKEEKPPKYKEKGELEALFFAIQTKRNAGRRKPYIPPEGLGLHDLESAWTELEKAEHSRQGALIGELQRQERLELRAQLFHKKADVRDAWLREMQSVLNQFECQQSAQTVEAGLRLLRNISAESIPKTSRFALLSELSIELQREHFHDFENIRTRAENILSRWNTFLAILAQRESELGRLGELSTLLGELEELGEELTQLGQELVRQRTQENCKHLAAVDELLRRLELTENNIRAKKEWLIQLSKRARQFAKSVSSNNGQNGTEQLFECLNEREKQLNYLQSELKQHRNALQRAKEFFQFIAHWEEQRGWLADRLSLCRFLSNTRDLSNISQSQRAHKSLEAEMAGQWERTKLLIGDGERLNQSEEVHGRLEILQKQWEELRVANIALLAWIREADRLQQYFQDANETESWIRERMPLTQSEDFGRDISTSECLWRRHRQLEKEIFNYETEIQRLNILSNELTQTKFILDENIVDGGLPDIEEENNKNMEEEEEEEIVVPKVVALYAYNGNNKNKNEIISVNRGEELALLDTSNKDWWRVLTRTGIEGYLPSNYCELIKNETVEIMQPKIIKKLNKRKEGIISLDGPSAIEKRQNKLNSDYQNLTSLSQKRGKALEEATNLFKFFAECTDFEQWAKITGQNLQEPLNQEHLPALQKKFRKVRDEINNQGQTQFSQLIKMSEQFIQCNNTNSYSYSRVGEILKRKEKIIYLWSQLQSLLNKKSAKLEFAQNLWNFNEKCADTKEWLEEKREQMQRQPPPSKIIGNGTTTHSSHDLKALQAAQRRLQNMERDLRPLADRMNTLWTQAKQISEEQPERAEEVQTKVQSLEAMHAELLAQARAWIEQSERSQGQQMFEQAASELLGWTQKCSQQMDLSPSSLPSASEEALRRNAELREQIDGKQFEFGYVEELGQRLIQKGHPKEQVKQRLEELEDAKNELECQWQKREADCRRLLEMQAFTREADRINSLNRGQLAFLDLSSSQADSVEKVQNLLKGQAEFEAKLSAQEERVLSFVASADRLIRTGHSQSTQIENQKREVLYGHQGVIERTQMRRSQLERGLALEGLRRDASELGHWISEKRRQMEQQNEVGGLNWAQTRHQAFMLELPANRAELSRLAKSGATLIRDGIAEREAVANVLEPLEVEWTKLEKLARQRSDLLQQEEQKVSLLEAINEINGKIEEIGNRLSNKTKGKDLRGVKQLINKNVQTGQEIQLLEDRLNEISKKANKMNEKKHSAAPEILERVEVLNVRFNSLHGPLEKMREELEESMGWHQLAFDADVELQWIGEKQLLVECPQLGHSLTEVQQLVKRHEQLTAELDCHQPLVTELLNKGRKLANFDGINGHSCRKEIDAKCLELSNSWTKLMELSAKRRKLLNRTLSREQLLFELSEAENWLSEKNKQLETREEEAISEGHGGAQALFAWLRTFQNELGPFQTSLAELRNKCINLKELGINEEQITERELQIKAQANALEEHARLSAEHADALLNIHNLEEEQQELEQWLEQKSKILSQDDCGGDLEQWEKIQAKFNDERQQIRALGYERLQRLENEANILSKKAPEHAREVLKGQNRLHALWELINEYIEQRESSLAQAEILYRFLRDAEELEERLREKEMTLPNDLGRDAKQSYVLILKHEVFENELAQLREEIEALVASGSQFEQLEENIKLRPLVDSWTRLQEASLHRGEQLMATYETHKFISQVRDLLQWTQSALVEMGGEQTIRDLQTAEWLAEEHRRLRAELEGREQERSLLVNIGRELERAGHCPVEVVHQRLAGLDQAFASVRKEWALKADWLEQAVQWHAFQREAIQILAQIQARDRSLDALEQQREFDKQSKEDKKEKSPAHRKKELNTLVRVLATLEERISRLGEMAETLEEQGHAETEQIQALTRRVMNALNELGEHANSVKRSLDAAEELTQFEAELADLTDWLIEKEESFRTQQATSFISSNDSGQLTNKLERLKRQQALQSELAANTPRLEKLRAHKEKIRNRQRGADVKQALTHCDEFFQRWDQLLAQSKALDAALEEARDLLELEQLADRFGTFLRDKEALVQAEELGGDLEHCQTLINRLKEAHKGVDEKTLIEANILAKKRMINSKGGNSESSHILARLNDINEGWERLSGRIQTYQALLEAALEVHRFNRDVDETNQRIGEKTSILSAEQQAKDLAGVERLLRAQDQAERDMSAIHRKLNEHDEQAKLLLAQEPPLRETVLDSLRKLELSWQRLAELAHARRQALQQAYSLHHFLDLVRRTDQWAQLIRAKMSGQAPSRNVAEAERALQRHAERLAEIGARDDEFRALRELGQRLLQEQPEHRSDLQRAQRRLQTLEHQTRQYWEREQQTLEQSLLFQKILSQIGQIDCWLAGKQAQLDGLTAGESPESAEVAIRELGHFIVALEPQLAERFSWFDSTNKTLDSLTNDYPEGNRVKERVDEIKEKCIELQKQTETKQRNLNANKHLAKFLRECAELITWMNAKLQLAMDDGYLDATALRLKLKKHLAFDAELRASQERVDRLQKRGQYLLNEEFGKDSTEDKEESEERVRAQIQELNNGWNELLAKSAEKTDRLRNAHEAHQLERRIVESECWLERVEAIICSEDHGTDCSSAEQLLEQFEILRTEIRAKGSLIEELCEEASKLVEKTGEDLGTNRQLLCERAEALQARWNAIEEPCQIRAENLSEAVSFYHWADQTDEQLEWLEARVRSLESSDYGRSLHSAQSLLQKHQILEKEFGVRQPAFSQLITTGEKMLLVEMKNNNSNKDNKKEKKQKGPKSDELTERLDKLHDLITLFRALASVREQRLNESLLSQEFYAEAAEAEHWMKERLIPSTNHQQFSHQQESGRQAEAQLRRCLALEKEILTFEDQLKKLGEKCERMVSADHFDLTGLQTRHVQLQELFFQLSSQCHQRKTQTTNAIRYFGFVRRADELLQWLRERLALAEREDYGQDLEECELLAQQFHEVVRELASAGERVAQILTLKEELLREKHPNAGSIRAKGQDVQQLWHEVNEAANERQQALMDGKNIHLFDQKADELLERLAEKEAHLLALSEEQCGGIDLDQMIGQRERLNNEFMLSLNVLSRQVLELCAEADHIVELFPRTSEHLEVRRGELIEQLKDVREGADRQTERLAQSQVNHQYFQEFRELMIWARQMHATITGELLPKEVAGCEALSARHAEFRREISSKEAEKLKITQKGDQMLAQGHNALINEIRSRITTLEEVFTDLLRTWHRRQQIYEDNADLQRWLSSASELERWLTEREQLLAQDWTGLVQDGLEAVEHQIRQFDDFLATLDAQSPQFEALKRLTRLEQNWERLKGQEDRERIAAVNARLQQQQQNRRETQPIRTLEKKKMLQEKRQERERRKTQEISLMGNSAGGIGRQSATGHSIRSSTSAHSGAHMLGQIQQLEPVQSMSTTAFNNSSQTLPRARQRAAGGATSSASSSTSVVVVEGQQTIVPPVSSSRLSIEISQPSSTQQQQNSTPSAPFPVGMRVPPTGRTPGFTTRRTQSIRRSRQWDDLRTVDIHGYLDRKQELQAGGKRATFRSWKSYYSILCGQLLCFFKDEQHFMENMAASAPLALHGSNSALNPEYIKKRFVFKLNTADGAEFLFAAPDQLKALEWVDKINFRAKLDPADQLLAFRPSTSEPLGNPQSRRLPYSSTAADIMSNSRSTTLEPRPKPRELGGNVVNTFKLPNESQKMIKSATLDPRRIGDDKHNYYSSTNQKNEGIEQKIENQQFASQIKIGEEVEEEEKIIVEEEDLENSPNNNCRNNQNGSSHIFEDTISVRSGMGGTIKSKKITSGAFAFLRRSSAVIGGKKSACENSLDLN